MNCKSKMQFLFTYGIRIRNIRIILGIRTIRITGKSRTSDTNATHPYFRTFLAFVHRIVTISS